MTLLITADDFGWTRDHNHAVAHAATHGVLNRASLLCNGDAFDDAIALGRALPQLGVGIHLTLSEGAPLSPPGRLRALCRPDGAFHDDPRALLRLWLRGELDLDRALGEWRLQARRAVQAGLRPTHLDSHKHVHLLPPLLDAALTVSREFGVPYLRLPLEAPSPGILRRAPGWLVLSSFALRARRRMAQAGVSWADRFLGFADSGAMDAGRLLRAVKTARRYEGTTEIMVHPARRGPGLRGLAQRYAWARTYRFEAELDALCHPAVRAAVSETPSPRA